MNHRKLQVDGIFLDLDGTLVDSTEAYLEAARLAFRALEKTPPPQTQTMLEIARRIEQRLPMNDIIGKDKERFMAVYLKAYYSLTEVKTKLIPNVSTTLQRLSGKAKLALITMRHVPNQVIHKELDYLGISRYFIHVMTALDTSEPKPSPEALFECAKILDLKMCNCIIAGDSVNDIRAGKAAGAVTVAVLSGLYKKDELIKERPDFILSDLTFLPYCLE